MGKSKRVLIHGLVASLFAIVLAVGIPAGSKIVNQASMSYKDANGKPHTVTSNTVETVVRQIWGFIIKPDGSEADPGQVVPVRPGETAYFNYTVTNVGNGVDTIGNLTVAQGGNDDYDFANPRIYHDIGCDGRIDDVDEQISSISLKADETACLIIAAGVPAQASEGDYGNLNISGISSGRPALDPDGNGIAGDDNNWSRAISSNGAILDIQKSASPTDYTRAGDDITYSLQGSNSGNAAASSVNAVVTVDGNPLNGILISDAIPAHTHYVPGSMQGDSDSGAILMIWKTATGWTANEPAADAVEEVGFLIRGQGAFFAPDATYDLSFTVNVDEQVSPEDLVLNRAHLLYDGNGDGKADDPALSGDDGESRNSNTTEHKVLPSYGVLVGPSKDADSDGGGFSDVYVGPDGTNWTYSETADTSAGRNDDMEALTSPVVHTGEAVYFHNSVMNHGNTSDSYRLSIESAPDGWACVILSDDGATPISKPIGPLGPGGTSDFVVACTIPSGNDHAETNPAVFNDVVIRATSQMDPAQHNLTTDRLSDVEPELSLDLANHGQSGDSDPSDDDPAARSSAPGATIDYPLDVTNTGSRPDSYTYSADLPPGWTVDYFADTDCDGLADNPEHEVAETTELSPGETACYVARVTIAPDANPGDYAVDYHATSKADPSLSDTVHAPVKIVIEVHLDIQKTASTSSVHVGDIIAYSLTIVSRSSVPLATTVTDTPDEHLRYLAGSADTDCNISDSEPAVSSGKLVWRAINMPAGDGKTCAIHYRMRVLAGASDPIPNTVIAEGVGAGGLVRDSGYNNAEVRLAEGVFQHRRGTLIGRVFLDRNNDDRYDAATDIAIPNARVILENGRQVLTDRQGRYSFRDIESGVWQVMLDNSCQCYEPKPHPETVDGVGFRHRVRVEGLTISDFPLQGPGGRIAASRKTKLRYGPIQVEKELIQLEGLTRIVLKVSATAIIPSAVLRDPLPGEGEKAFDLSGLSGTKTFTYDLRGKVWMTDPIVDWRSQ